MCENKNEKENIKQVSLLDTIGKGYYEFWHSKKRYVVCKGSRASKKSKTTALWLIWNIMKYPKANAVVYRKVGRSLRDSCFAELKWAINTLGVSDYWKAHVNPLELIYKPHKKAPEQKILFRGLYDALNLTSLSVEHGHICFAWLEEAYEIMDEEKFKLIDEGLRGKMPPELWIRIMLTFNPWNDRHWLKKRFFDAKDKSNILTLTTNYKINEWLSDADLSYFETMRINDPRRYQVAGLGDWGVVEGLVYENFEERFFVLKDIKKIPDIQSAFGLDFGYTNDPTAFFCGFISLARKEIYVFDELYKKRMSNELIYQEIYKMGYSKERIMADSAEPKSIDRLRYLGLSRIRAARKGKDSVLNGIDFIRGFKIIVHPRCVNFLTEISNYSYDKDKMTGETINKPIDYFNHLMDAMRYAIEKYIRPEQPIKVL